MPEALRLSSAQGQTPALSSTSHRPQNSTKLTGMKAMWPRYVLMVLGGKGSRRYTTPKQRASRCHQSETKEGTEHNAVASFQCMHRGCAARDACNSKSRCPKPETKYQQGPDLHGGPVLPGEPAGRREEKEENQREDTHFPKGQRCKTAVQH